MTRYLVASHHPDGYDLSRDDEAMGRDIDALNNEMIAAADGGQLCHSFVI